MAFVLKDRVKETSTTSGTGTLTLAGAVTGFQSFAAIGDSNNTYYCIVDGSAWEVGIGTYTSSGTTLSRDTVLESSNNGDAINLSGGTAEVFVTYPAEKSVNLDKTQTLANKTLTNVTLTLTSFDQPTLASPTITGSIDEAVYTLTGTSLDPANGTIQVTTLSANTTFTEAFSEGESMTLMIDDGSAYTITWPTMTWVNNGAAAPDLATDAYTVVSLWKVSTTLYGALVGTGA